MDRAGANSAYVAGATRLLLGPRIIGSFDVQPEGPPRDPNVRPHNSVWRSEEGRHEAACRCPMGLPLMPLGAAVPATLWSDAGAGSRASSVACVPFPEGASQEELLTHASELAGFSIQVSTRWALLFRRTWQPIRCSAPGRDVGVAPGAFQAQKPSSGKDDCVMAGRRAAYVASVPSYLGPLIYHRASTGSHDGRAQDADQCDQQHHYPPSVDVDVADRLSLSDGCHGDSPLLRLVALST